MPLAKLQLPGWKHHICLHSYNDLVITQFCLVSDKQKAPEAILNKPFTTKNTI